MAVCRWGVKDYNKHRDKDESVGDLVALYPQEPKENGRL